LDAWMFPLLDLVIDSIGHKVSAVSSLGLEASKLIVDGTHPESFRLVLPFLTRACQHDKAKVKLFGMSTISELAEGRCSTQVANDLYELVPLLTVNMWDCKDEVVEAARRCLEVCCVAANNRDLKPFIPKLINCVLHPENVPECVHQLAATVFVQEIKSPALAVTVPLLERGLNERDTVIRRKACTIVENMCKMIDHPEEAIAFMPKIKPMVSRAAEEIPDPEARGVAGKTLKTLLGIEEAAIESRQLNPEAVLEIWGSVFPATDPSEKKLGYEEAVAHVCKVCSSLITDRNFEHATWREVLEEHMKPFAPIAQEASDQLRDLCYRESRPKVAEEDWDEEGEDLCNIEFSLGYGAMMLLTNTRLHMKRGKRYGLCGPNGCGKSTLMRAIVNGQVDGFPPPDKLRTVYVEHDIQGADVSSCVIDFVLSDPRLKEESRDEVTRVLKSVGFTDELLAKSIQALSGGWKMKVALARAMLLKADILLLDEPTNHLDKNNVQWLEEYLTSLHNVTSMVVSHDSRFLDRICTHITHFEKNRKLKTYRGNLAEFVRQKPEAKAYYELASEEVTFTLPEPGFLEGVKSKGKAILKMSDVSFAYPGSSKPTVSKISLQASLLSRVAVVGPNGAGKSTIIKLLTGELKPDSGTVWKHPNMRIAYVAQHAFHHLEKHLDKTPNEYIQWRYAGGEDKESLTKEGKKVTEEEEEQMKKVQMIWTDDGNVEKRVVEEIMGRRKLKGGYEYEVKWVGLQSDKNSWLEREKLVEMGFTKMLNRVDEREALRLGTSGKALTAKNVEDVLGKMGLEAEFATHNRIRGLSGGQKVKVVLAAAMWEDPHILVLDEPTNYLDRDSLGALATAMKTYGGGVIMISHNHEFTREVCTETWICEEGRLKREGKSFTDDVKIVAPTNSLFTGEKKEVKDSYGNTIQVENQVKLTGKDLKKYKKMKEARKKRGEDVSDSE
ncbi:hypothetical protein GUITHDRAFT_68804, partial [Guillardia theta CCMP2712]